MDNRDDLAKPLVPSISFFGEARSRRHRQVRAHGNLGRSFTPERLDDPAPGSRRPLRDRVVQGGVSSAHGVQRSSASRIARRPAANVTFLETRQHRLSRTKVVQHTGYGAYLPMGVGAPASPLLLIMRLGIEYGVFTRDVNSHSIVG